MVKNAVTLVNGLLGFLSIVKVSQGKYELGAFLILAAMVFDLLDGYVSRKYEKPDRYGLELDSLCDVISFGVAPAFLAINTFLGSSDVAMLAAFVVVIGGISRLARFNVLAESTPSSIFIGLPIPASAFGIVVFYNLDVTSIYAGAAFCMLMGVLNVSKFRYPSQKKLMKTRKTAAFFALAGIAILAAYLLGYFWWALFAFFLSYVLTGIINSVKNIF